MRCIHQYGPSGATVCGLCLTPCSGNPTCALYEAWDGRYDVMGCARLIGRAFREHIEGLPEREHKDIRDHPRCVR